MEKWLILGTKQKILEHLVVMESTKAKKKKAKQNIKAKQSQDGAISKEQMNK